MQGRSRSASVPLVPFTAARRWHWPSVLTLVVSVAINVLWIVLIIWAIGVGIDLWLEHSDKLPRMLWRATKV